MLIRSKFLRLFLLGFFVFLLSLIVFIFPGFFLGETYSPLVITNTDFVDLNVFIESNGFNIAELKLEELIESGEDSVTYILRVFNDDDSGHYILLLGELNEEFVSISQRRFIEPGNFIEIPFTCDVDSLGSMRLLSCTTCEFRSRLDILCP